MAGAGSLCPGPLRLARLPLARVKALVKADPDVSLASQEAVYILAFSSTRYYANNFTYYLQNK
uniref:Uncharacterized protein n=1 Tax=Apteryx owenii TaxID=8824 RepID=A0A8B9Q6W3_APTOW